MMFGLFLKQMIDRGSLNEATLARKIGVRQQYLSAVESGREKPPSIKRCEQIAEVLELSKKDRDQLYRLAILGRANKEMKPFLENLEHKKSVIHFSEKESEYVKVPLLGSCPASPKSWVDDEVQAWHYFPKEILRGRRLYLLKAKGDSMNKAGIDDGDLVIVDADSQPTNGRIVVVCVDHEYTMKRFYRNDEQVTLMPDSNNQIHAPMMFSAKKSEILLRGVVEAVHWKRLK